VQEKQDRILHGVEQLLAMSGQRPAAAATVTSPKKPGCAEKDLDVGSAPHAEINGCSGCGSQLEYNAGGDKLASDGVVNEITLSNPPPVLTAAEILGCSEGEGAPGVNNGGNEKNNCGNSGGDGCDEGYGDGNGEFCSSGGGCGGGVGGGVFGAGGSSCGDKLLKSKMVTMPSFPSLVFVPCSPVRRRKRAPLGLTSANLHKSTVNCGATASIRLLSVPRKDQLKTIAERRSRSLSKAFQTDARKDGDQKTSVMAGLPWSQCGSDHWHNSTDGGDGSRYRDAAAGVSNRARMGKAGTGLPDEGVQEPVCTDCPGGQTASYLSLGQVTQETALVDTIGFSGEQACKNSDLLLPGLPPSWIGPYLGGLSLEESPAVIWGHGVAMEAGAAAADGGGGCGLSQ
jgi:hypothetical protein